MLVVSFYFSFAYSVFCSRLQYYATHHTLHKIDVHFNVQPNIICIYTYIVHVYVYNHLNTNQLQSTKCTDFQWLATARMKRKRKVMEHSVEMSAKFFPSSSW